MIPWRHLDTAEVPDGGGELRLMQRGTEFSIMAGATSLMTSHRSGSEETLARWKLWLIGNSRTIVLVMLMVIGAILIARGTYSLTA